MNLEGPITSVVSSKDDGSSSDDRDLAKSSLLLLSSFCPFLTDCIILSKVDISLFFLINLGVSVGGIIKPGLNSSSSSVGKVLMGIASSINVALSEMTREDDVDKLPMNDDGL